jgi:hypothetical protein
MMKEGQCLSSLASPLSRIDDDDALPNQELAHWVEAEAEGVKKPS